MPSVEQSERIGGVVILSVPAFDAFVWILDSWARVELLVRLHDQLPPFLVSPVTAFVCLCIGLALLYRSSARQLQRVSDSPQRRVVDASGDGYSKIEKPKWVMPLLICFVATLIATPILAVAYSIAYKGYPPMKAKAPAPPYFAYLKTPKPEPLRTIPHSVENVLGGIRIGRDNYGNAVVNNNYGHAPEVPAAGVVPTIAVCVLGAVTTTDGYFGKGSYLTAITLKTDTEISQPAFGFLFDGPVGDGKGDVIGLSTMPYMWDPLESTCRHASLSIL